MVRTSGRDDAGKSLWIYLSISHITVRCISSLTGTYIVSVTHAQAWSRMCQIRINSCSQGVYANGSDPNRLQPLKRIPILILDSMSDWERRSGHICHIFCQSDTSQTVTSYRCSLVSFVCVWGLNKGGKWQLSIGEPFQALSVSSRQV